MMLRKTMLFVAAAGLLNCATAAPSIARTKPSIARISPPSTQTSPPRPSPPPSGPAPALADPDFFWDLSRVRSVEIYPGYTSPLVPCTANFVMTGSLLDCHERVVCVAPKQLRNLIDFLARFTWFRVQEGSPTDLKAELGLKFGQGSGAVQLLVDVDHGSGRGDPSAMGEAVFWAPRQGAMNAYIPKALGAELKRLVLILLMFNSSPQSAAAAERSGENLVPYLDPECDCVTGLNEFIYYEEAPVRIEAPHPKRPSAARHGGRVILQALVGKRGEVCAIHVVQHVDGLTEAAIEGVKHWKFRPALATQGPVCVWVEVPLDF